MAELEKKEQETPFAPSNSQTIDIEERKNKSFSVEYTRPPRWKCIKCCGCCIAIILILATIMLVLMVTVFHVKDPILNMNSFMIDGVDVLRRSTDFHPGLNITVVADVSIKNPNVASFKFRNATTNLYYDGSIIGEARSPEGRARARRTLRMNVTIVAMVDKILKVPRLKSDLAVGIMPISTYTRISGKVKIVNVVRRHVIVRMNCTMNVNISSQAIQDQNCKRRVSL